MEARITVNDVNVMDAENLAKARVAFLAVAKTQNPLSKTATGYDMETEVQSKAGIHYFKDADAAIAHFGQLGEPTSTVIFYELPEGQKVEKVAATYTMEKFVNRCAIAAHVTDYIGKIADKPTTGKKDSDKVEQADEF